MEDDLIISLTRQVKEEVVENYLLERRLIDLQMEHLKSRSLEVRRQARIAGLRLARLSILAVSPGMQSRLWEILGIKTNSFWTYCMNVEFKGKVRFIRARALTRKARFRKVLLESYSRFYSWTNQYKTLYEDLAKECLAVNRNIDSFHKNFDLLSILNFIRNLDMHVLDKKKILGDNFTAKEMAELDKSLYISQISMEKLDLPAPLDLPECDSIRGKILNLADEIFLRHPEEVKTILQ